ncbi:carbohydrate porin [Methylocystis parvus]|uniref:carbohydrate porin n=1 Tax=Methylocystis parvus TaxID=134 RepID=UPI003C7323B8
MGRNRLDEWGLGAGWSKTNGTALDLAQTSPYWQSEWVIETYHNYTVFKAVKITPDVQFFMNPALLNDRRVTEIFTLRTTWTF